MLALSQKSVQLADVIHVFLGERSAMEIRMDEDTVRQVVLQTILKDQKLSILSILAMHHLDKEELKWVTSATIYCTLRIPCRLNVRRTV